jgi:RNA polymerase sigma-70 factor (ECF subfamily)
MSSHSPTGDNRSCAGSEPPGQDYRPDLREIVVRHHEAVYRYAYRLAGNQADAEDLTQQAFLVAQQRLSQVREINKVLGWLFSVLRNCYLKSCRRNRKFLSDGVEIDIEQVPEPPQREEIDEAELQLALAELPDEFRIVVLMFYFEDCSYKEIAARLEIPIGTVMSRLARAKGHLRQWLTNRAVRAETEQTPLALEASARQRISAEMQIPGPIRMDR